VSPLRFFAGPWRRAAALSLVLLLAACGKVVLYGQLTEREANEMLALLLRSGIDAEKTVGKDGATLSVASDRIPDAMALLDANGLPKSRFTNMGELFQREGLVSSPAEERVRYIYGITQELSRTLTTIDGVIDARVHVVLPNNDPVTGAQAKPASAAVLIRYTPNAAIDTLMPKIKELVANSIEGMSYDRVSVVLVRAEQASPSSPEIPVAEPLPRQAVVIGAGLLGLSLVGNLLAVGFIFWRRRSHTSGAMVTVP
jgi:type III secretion protein J